MRGCRRLPVRGPQKRPPVSLRSAVSDPLGSDAAVEAEIEGKMGHALVGESP